MDHDITEATLDDLEGVLALCRHLHTNDVPMDHDTADGVMERIHCDPDMRLYLLRENAETLVSCYLNIVPNLTRGVPTA